VGLHAPQRDSVFLGDNLLLVLKPDGLSLFQSLSGSASQTGMKSLPAGGREAKILSKRTLSRPSGRVSRTGAF